MKNAETYLRDFSYPREHIREIVERAQKDAFDEGYRVAAHQMLATAEQTMKRVHKITNDARTTVDHG